MTKICYLSYLPNKAFNYFKEIVIEKINPPDVFYKLYSLFIKDIQKQRDFENKNFVSLTQFVYSEISLRNIVEQDHDLKELFDIKIVNNYPFLSINKQMNEKWINKVSLMNLLKTLLINYHQSEKKLNIFYYILKLAETEENQYVDEFCLSTCIFLSKFFYSDNFNSFS